MIVDLVLVCFPLVASAPEPVLHCKNGGGLPVEEHWVASSPEPVRHGRTAATVRSRSTAPEPVRM